MFLLKLLMKVLLLPVMLVLFVLRVLVKIGIELSSIVIGGLMLIVFGCIIYAIVQQMWSSAFILIAMEACIIMIVAGAGTIEFFLGECVLEKHIDKSSILLYSSKYYHIGEFLCELTVASRSPRSNS